MQIGQIIIVLALGALLTLFAIENMAVIDVSFLGQDFQTRRILLIVSVFAIGFICGKLIRVRPKKKK